MFGKVKKWLGIEGLKLELVLPDEVELSTEVVDGKIILMSMSDQVVSVLNVKMIEQFSRGRRKDKLTDEYVLGEESITDKIKVTAQTPLEIDFSLPFKIKKSEMDEMEDSNPLLSGAVKAAKWLRGVKSTYRIEVKAEVEGTMINPFVKRVLIVV